MTRGGKRKGSGRPTKENKKKAYATNLRPDQIVWLRTKKRGWAAKFFENKVDEEIALESSSCHPQYPEKPILEGQNSSDCVVSNANVPTMDQQEEINTLEKIMSPADLSKTTGLSLRRIQQLAPDLIKNGHAIRIGKPLICHESAIKYIMNLPETRGRKKQIC